MITVAIAGILAAIAIPAFMDYMKRTKQTEMVLQLNKIEKSSKTYWITNATLPQGVSSWLPTAGLIGACPTKWPVTTAWTTDPVWQSLDFEIDEPSYANYLYFGFGTSAFAYSFFDLDCDGVVTGHLYEFDTFTGDFQTTRLMNIFGPD